MQRHYETNTQDGTSTMQCSLKFAKSFSTWDIQVKGAQHSQSLLDAAYPNIQSIQRHIVHDTPSIDLHIEKMNLVQFHVGSTITFWELPFEEYGMLAPEGRMKNTWEALSHTSLILKGPNLGIPNEREGDTALMDAFVAQGYDQGMLITLNECRFYLAASHLSHISTANGTQIENKCWEGRQYMSDKRPKRIHTYKPTYKQWKNEKRRCRKHS
jgi:hypothetical protein